MGAAPTKFGQFSSGEDHSEGVQRCLMTLQHQQRSDILKGAHVGEHRQCAVRPAFVVDVRGGRASSSAWVSPFSRCWTAVYWTIVLIDT